MRSDMSNPKAKAAQRGEADASAIGVAVQFDPKRQRLEIRYLSNATSLTRFASELVSREFHLDRPQADVWRLASDTRERGDFPVHFAVAMLGFGGYR